MERCPFLGDYGRESCAVKMLLERGADERMTDHDGDRVLLNAVERHDTICTEFLLNLEANRHKVITEDASLCLKLYLKRMKASARTRKGTTVLLPWHLRRYVITGIRSES